jgi:tRNA nucleotidyltransferase/poly(A) polymerase
VKQLRDEGFVAFWAGGCVRDELLGLAPKDYDVATNATPDEVFRVFRHRRTIAVGVSFGVVTVVGGRQAGNVEVATFRRDLGYTDGRRPDSVSFSSPEEDAQRRDFTINGMFFDPLENRVHDYVGGQADLRNGIVRCIGEPHQRFSEDKLRLLRAVRFCAAFEFELERDTLSAIQDLAGSIVVVSAERIANEMRRILRDSHRIRGLEFLQQTGLRAYLLPEFGGPCDVIRREWPEGIVLCGTVRDPSFELALSALLWPLTCHKAPPAVVEPLASRWKLANRERDLVEQLLRDEAVVRQADVHPWSTVQPIVIRPSIDEVIELARAVARHLGQSPAGVEFCHRQLARPECELNPDPLVNGDDLIRLGISAGVRFGAILTAIRNAQLDGQITSRQDAEEMARAMARES